MSLHPGSERRAGPLIWIKSPASEEQTVGAGDALPIRRRHMEPGLEAAILPLVLAASIFGPPARFASPFAMGPAA